MNTILFCHIPKCGGTSINSVLQKKYKENYTWYCHRILQYDIDNYINNYKFTIIRDPVQKLVSLYFYQKNIIERLEKQKNLNTYQCGNFNKIKNLYDKYNIFDIQTFLNNYEIFYKNEIEQYIDNLEYINSVKDMSCYYICGYLPQYLFICDDNENILVDDVFNIDNLSPLNEKLHINTNVKLNTHKNSTDNYNKHVTEKDIHMIRNIYAKDYQLFLD